MELFEADHCVRQVRTRPHLAGDILKIKGAWFMNSYQILQTQRLRFVNPPRLNRPISAVLQQAPT